ncbi:hypothetical protein BST61_g11139 [Cercospora zeina]
MNVASLRNNLAHLDNNDSNSLDLLLKRAQDLACTMRDEPRALEVRALRDELRELTEEAFAELTRLDPLIQLPDEIVWPAYHEATFQDVIRRLTVSKADPAWQTGSLQEDFYDPVVVRAAQYWAEQYKIPGLLNWHVSNRWVSLKQEEHMTNWTIEGVERRQRGSGSKQKYRQCK